MARLAELVVPFLKRGEDIMVNRRFVIGATLAGSMLFAATAFAQGQPVVGISTVTT
jgi:hypothetical protein